MLTLCIFLSRDEFKTNPHHNLKGLQGPDLLSGFIGDTSSNCVVSGSLPNKIHHSHMLDGLC